MGKQEIGRFYASSFDEKLLEFVVYDDNTMNCPTLEIDSFDKIELKPRFRIWREKRYYDYNVPSYRYGDSQLIGCYDIDEDLFAYLKERKMIKYSTDMAYLYGFEDKYGYDSEPNHCGVGSPYKWAKKKGPILVKQRSGQFN